MSYRHTEVLCRVIPGVNTPGMFCTYPEEHNLEIFGKQIPGTIYDVPEYSWYLVRMCQVYKTVPGKVILVRMIRAVVKYGLYCTL